MKTKSLISLDVGEKRIGVAVADLAVRIAVPFQTIEVDGNEVTAIAEIVVQEDADTIVVGYPRNQMGESTAQTNYVENFVKELEALAPTIVFRPIGELKSVSRVLFSFSAAIAVITI